MFVISGTLGTDFHGLPLDAPAARGHYHPRPGRAAIHSGLLVRQTSWDSHPGQDLWPPPSLLMSGTGRKYHCRRICLRAPPHRRVFMKKLDRSFLRFPALEVIARFPVHCRAACALTAMRVKYCVCRIFSCQRASGKSSPHLQSAEDVVLVTFNLKLFSKSR